MTHAPTEARRLVLAELRPHIAKVFTAQPAVRSILVAVAQYYADNAQDEVHTYLVASERDTPVWPHGCARWDDFAVAGESCVKCARALDWFSRLYTEVIVGFESYCRENADPEGLYAESYLPYGIFRRDGSFEVVGTVMRGFAELAPEGEITTLPPVDVDPREAELFEIACAHPDDNGSRHVLGDYLTEQGDPRGEYIALSLASSLDADSLARRDALLDEHRAGWMTPLDRVVPAACARFERGLLARVEAFASDSRVIDAVSGAPAWGSVETLRLLPGSLSILDPGMTALREVGPLTGSMLETLATAARPWAIESLHLVIYDFHDREVRQLLAATTLPRLRALTLAAIDFDWLAELRTAVWFAQLERLTILDAYEITLPWLARAAEFAPVRWLCASEKHDDRAAGWEIAYCAAERRVEVRLAGYWPWATRIRLAGLLPQLPEGSIELVGNRLWQPTDDDVRALSQTGRTVTRR